jgi:hypothetical protein
MIIKTSNFVSSRRQFLKGVLPTGTLFCFGCSSLLAMPFSKDKKKTSTEKHKFMKDSGLTVEEVFKFAYQNDFIPIMQNLAEDVGEKELVEMLKRASSKKAATLMTSMTQNLSKKDFAAFTGLIKGMLNEFPNNKALVAEIAKETDKVIELKITECLWAKTFNEAKASDIGYAVICSPTKAMVQAFNPKIKAENPKNFFLGDKICIERFVWEG